MHKEGHAYVYLYACMRIRHLARNKNTLFRFKKRKEKNMISAATLFFFLIFMTLIIICWT